MRRSQIRNLFNRFDIPLTMGMQSYGLTFLRYSLVLIFIWFGALKIMGASPAEEIVRQTFPWGDPSWFPLALGAWEVIIGLCFLFKRLIRLGILLLAPQMVGTFLPLILLPEVVFQGGNILFLTMEGQYIIKNLLIISAAMVIGSHVRDRDVIMDP